jgi:hypothetical protein
MEFPRGIAGRGLLGNQRLSPLGKKLKMCGRPDLTDTIERPKNLREEFDRKAGAILVLG